jgi:capsular polysaccharide biosynthesis protein
MDGGKVMEEEMTLDLRELLYILRKRMGLIIGITLAATIISIIISFFVLTPVYEAKMSVVIGKSSSGPPTSELDYSLNDVTMYQKLVKTYAEVAKSRVVAQSTLDLMNTELKVDDLMEMVTVTPQADTQLMDITVKSIDPEEAKQAVSSLTIAFVKRAESLIPNTSIEILDQPELPENPVSPNKKLNVAIAFFLGLMVSIGLVFVIEYMDNTVKTKEDVEKILNLPVIGLIPQHEAE